MHKATLHRALVNIVQYALRTVPHGSKLTLRGRRTPSHVHLAVHQRGEGLQANALPPPFSSSETTALEAGDLGLHVAQEIISVHGGRFGVSCQPGEGTTVTLTLPLRSHGEN
jgi:K+-sensing histidine kinase KdpD